MEYEFTPSTVDYSIIDGEKVKKVKNSYYSDKAGIVNAICPHCNSTVNRVWNLKYCGDCGMRISWNDIHVDNYHPI